MNPNFTSYDICRDKLTFKQLLYMVSEQIPQNVAGDSILNCRRTNGRTGNAGAIASLYNGCLEA